MPDRITIDLNEVRAPKNSGLLSGRDSGVAARQHFGVGKLDRSPGGVDVIIPDEVFSMNTSFFLGLFGDSVRFLGPEQFRTKYRFVGDQEIHGPTIERGIKKALKESTIFSEKKTAA